MERHVNALGTQEKRRTASGENHIHHLSPAQLRGTGISVAQKELLPNCHVSQLVVPVVNYYEADLLFFAGPSKLLRVLVEEAITR